MFSIKVIIDSDLGIVVHKELPLRCTVALLKERLCQDDPTGESRPEDITLYRIGQGAPLADSESITEDIGDVFFGLPCESPHCGDLVFESPQNHEVSKAEEIRSHLGSALNSASESLRNDDEALDAQLTQPDERLSNLDSESSKAERVDRPLSQVVEEWIVVSERVVKRAEPVKNAAAVALEKKGIVLQGLIIENAGIQWLKTVHKAGDEEVECFVMVDGACLGLGMLLEKTFKLRPGDYYVSLGILFRKPGSDPESQKIIKSTRKVGSIVHTTGKTWKGTSGGVWVELDPSQGEKPGWMMVDAPGFDTPIPCLQEARERDGPPIVLNMPRPRVYADGDPDMHDILVFQNTTAGQTKTLVAKLFGLRAGKFILSRSKGDQGQAGNVDVTAPGDLLLDSDTIWSAGLRTGSELPYVYTGDEILNPDAD